MQDESWVLGALVVKSISALTESMALGDRQALSWVFSWTILTREQDSTRLRLWRREKLLVMRNLPDDTEPDEVGIPSEPVETYSAAIPALPVPAVLVSEFITGILPESRRDAIRIASLLVGAVPFELAPGAEARQKG